jgi:4a-hydroxytetrahydrobiopterin dehydratase
MSDPRKTLTTDEVAGAGLAGWEQVDGKIRATFPTGDFATGLAFVALVGASAEEADHHPDLTLTYPEVVVELSSHDVGGITSRDIDLAREINRHAATLEVSASDV